MIVTWTPVPAEVTSNLPLFVLKRAEVKATNEPRLAKPAEMALLVKLDPDVIQ